MISLKEFKDYYKRLDEMIADSAKADLAEGARLVALNVAHYRAKYGELPIELAKPRVIVHDTNTSHALQKGRVEGT